MIQGVHAMFYAPEAEAIRAFLRDRLGLPARDVGDGWLVFDVSQVEVGVHPSEQRRYHEISFYCDDIHATVAELAARGVEFTGPVEDRGWGLTAPLRIPGGTTVLLYQRQYPTA